MPVRQSRHCPATRPDSPPGKTVTLPADTQDDEETSPEALPTEVVEVENSECRSNEVELLEPAEQNVEVDVGETEEASQDQTDSGEVEQYEDEGFEKDTDDGGDEADSVTSKARQDNDSCLDHGTYTDPTFDYQNDNQSIYQDYDRNDKEEFAKRNLVFHEVPESREMTDEQLVERVLAIGLKLDPNRYIKYVHERFGIKKNEFHMLPIRVEMQSAAKRNHVLSRAKELSSQAEFSGIVIHRYLSPSQIDQVNKELDNKYTELTEEGYQDLFRWRWRILQRVYGGQNIILYTPDLLTTTDL